MLIGRHQPKRPDPCRVCGADMSPSSIGGGTGTTYKCTVAAANYFQQDRSVEEHYRLSEQRITYHGDADIIDALHELRALREQAGEDMAVPVGTFAYPHGHGKGICCIRFRHVGGDQWMRDFDPEYRHDPTHDQEDQNR
ncbi:hypothetical protein [Verrucosispora sp. TAA-831]|uniref:hypothetical protein n=1 Tax=Verrucosispora sp. TAA-831 TaxID=3422227 RepID=UPI003D6EE71F